MITINGKSYKGNNVQITNNKVYVDGKLMDTDTSIGNLNIKVEGNLTSLKVDTCNSIEVNGDCDTVSTSNAKVICNNVKGNVTTSNATIKCGKISGNATTSNGDIKQKTFFY